MNFQKGDKVIVYGGDLWNRVRNATVIRHYGKKRHDYYMVEFANGTRSTVSEEWLEPHATPMEDSRDYLDALNELSNYR